MTKIKGTLAYSTKGEFEVGFTDGGWYCSLPCQSELNGAWDMIDSGKTASQAFLNVHGSARSMDMEFSPVVKVVSVPDGVDQNAVEAELAETVSSITKYMKKRN